MTTTQTGDVPRAKQFLLARHEGRVLEWIAARLPAGVDFAARPFGEPTLFRIAAAYEKATRHREPPSEFTGLPAGRTTAAK